MTELALALVILLLALTAVRILFVPLSLAFEARQWWRARRGDTGLMPAGEGAAAPLVSVVVPGYNEERVLAACVTSIVGSGYPNLEVVIVDDGSTDGTADLARQLARRHPQVRALTKPNGGKGSALNRGIVEVRGDIILLVDADGVFDERTIPEMLRAFSSERVGAVCGSDRPVNLDRIQTRFLALISHVGTGLVRRAMHMLRCMPVVSGNVGAFRRSALLDVAVPGMGPLRTDTLGEDLELTWRLHRSGYSVAFAPRAVVHAESPSTIRGLWRQRVRWARGLLQSLRLHRGAIGRPRHGIFGAYLVYTVVAMVLLPVVQILGTLALPALWAAGWWQPPLDALGILAEVGLALALVLVLIALLLDRCLPDLRHSWTLPLWPLYSLLMSATLIRGLAHEVAGTPQTWNKLQRTGVISIAVPAGGGPRRALPARPDGVLPAVPGRSA